MSEGDELSQRLAAASPLATPFRKTVFRSCSPRYANLKDLISGEGGRLHAGRWNPPGLRVIYASLTPETALAEALSHFHYYGLQIEEAFPRTMVALSVDLRRVLDLTNPEVHSALRITSRDMTDLDWRKEFRQHRLPMTAQIGSAAASNDLQGLLVPSAASNKSENLLVYPGNLDFVSQVTVLSAEKLT